MSEGKIADEAIREELLRVLESPIFAQSDRLTRFLRFTVETTLSGRGETLKEYLIGTEVYDRKPPYHPSSDSIVRSEARRLRNKLRQYYESVGKDDPTLIYYRIGTYVPAFRSQRARDHTQIVRTRTIDEILTEGVITQAVDLSSVTGKLDVRIVFEGTIRVLYSGAKCSPSAKFRHGENISKRQPTRRVLSMSLKKAVEG